MIEFVATKSTSASVAFAIGAATLFSAQVDYPQRSESYKIQQIGATHSSFLKGLLPPSIVAQDFTKQVADIFSYFAQRQEALGAEFEAAIYDDLEGLYEA